VLVALAGTQATTGRGRRHLIAQAANRRALRRGGLLRLCRSRQEARRWPCWRRAVSARPAIARHLALGTKARDRLAVADVESASNTPFQQAAYPGGSRTGPQSFVHRQSLPGCCAPTGPGLEQPDNPNRSECRCSTWFPAGPVRARRPAQLVQTSRTPQKLKVAGVVKRLSLHISALGALAVGTSGMRKCSERTPLTAGGMPPLA